MLFCKLFLLLYSTEMKQKKSKHGSVLRHVVLKSVSSQMVSASVSVKLIVCLIVPQIYHLHFLFFFIPAYSRSPVILGSIVINF